MHKKTRSLNKTFTKNDAQKNIFNRNKITQSNQGDILHAYSQLKKQKAISRLSEKDINSIMQYFLTNSSNPHSQQAGGIPPELGNFLINYNIEAPSEQPQINNNTEKGVDNNSQWALCESVNKTHASAIVRLMILLIFSLQSVGCSLPVVRKHITQLMETINPQKNTWKSSKKEERVKINEKKDNEEEGEDDEGISEDELEESDEENEVSEDRESDEDIEGDEIEESDVDGEGEIEKDEDVKEELQSIIEEKDAKIDKIKTETNYWKEIFSSLKAALERSNSRGDFSEFYESFQNYQTAPAPDSNDNTEHDEDVNNDNTEYTEDVSAEDLQQIITEKETQIDEMEKGRDDLEELLSSFETAFSEYLMDNKSYNGYIHTFLNTYKEHEHFKKHFEEECEMEINDNQWRSYLKTVRRHLTEKKKFRKAAGKFYNKGDAQALARYVQYYLRYIIDKYKPFSMDDIMEKHDILGELGKLGHKQDETQEGLDQWFSGYNGSIIKPIPLTTRIYCQPKSIERQRNVEKNRGKKWDMRPKEIKKVVKFLKKYRRVLIKGEKKWDVNCEFAGGVLKKETELGKVKIDRFRAINAIITFLDYFFVDYGIRGEARKKQEKRLLGKFRKLGKENLVALFNHCIKHDINPTKVKSNFGMAMGYPQLLPKNLPYAERVNDDGELPDLKHMPDAIMTVLSMLRGLGVHDLSNLPNPPDEIYNLQNLPHYLEQEEEREEYIKEWEVLQEEMIANLEKWTKANDTKWSNNFEAYIKGVNIEEIPYWLRDKLEDYWASNGGDDVMMVAQDILENLKKYKETEEIIQFIKIVYNPLRDYATYVFLYAKEAHKKGICSSSY